MPSPTARPRIVHVLHTLPVQAMLLDPPRASDAPHTTLSRRHSRASSTLSYATPDVAGVAAAAAALHHQQQQQHQHPLAPEQRWTLVPRHGHNALYSGIRSLAEPQEGGADLAYECVYVGDVGPVLDVTGRVLEGFELTPADRDHLTATLWTEHRCVSVFLDEHLAHDFYQGYCKSSLWPLMHYILSEPSDGRRERAQWAAYLHANHAYANAALPHIRPDDLVFIHDYHLLACPSILRDRLETAVIGLFIHTPFPSSELLRCLPQRAEVLQGMLGASLIGFQHYSYARHFVSSCTRVLGLESTPTGVDFHGHHVQVGIFPIGIDVAQAEVRRRSASVRAKTAALRDMYAGKKIIVGRDKMDSIKGVYQKLLGFEKFLETFPEHRGKVVLVQVTSPPGASAAYVQSDGESLLVHPAPSSGPHIPSKLDAKISELVSHINGKFGSMEHAPVHHIHRSIAQDEFYALLSAADVGLITSTRDGMNTTSHEFIVCQQPLSDDEDNDVSGDHMMAPLILSEFTGTAGSMSAALLVNPWDYLGVATALHAALTMPREEKYMRHRQLFDHVTRYTAPHWARAFVSALAETAARGASGDAHTTPVLDRHAAMRDYLAVVTPHTNGASSDGEMVKEALLVN